MSYCRWSSDGWKSDVYVYEDVMGGWTTHVAGMRRVGLETLPQDPYDYAVLKNTLPSDWADVCRAYHKALNELELVPIDLPHAGESFNDPTPGKCAERLLRLRELGYHVPQYAIDELQEEEKNGRED